MKRVIAACFVLGAVAAPAAMATPRISSVVNVAATPTGLRYATTALHAKAGRIEIVFANPSALPHNVRIEQGETELGGTKTITHGKTSTFVTLKRGVYHFYCSVPGHEDAGMSGTLTVA